MSAPRAKVDREVTRIFAFVAAGGLVFWLFGLTGIGMSLAIVAFGAACTAIGRSWGLRDLRHFKKLGEERALSEFFIANHLDDFEVRRSMLVRNKMVDYSKENETAFLGSVIQQRAHNLDDDLSKFQKYMENLPEIALRVAKSYADQLALPNWRIQGRVINGTDFIIEDYTNGIAYRPGDESPNKPGGYRFVIVAPNSISQSLQFFQINDRTIKLGGMHHLVQIDRFAETITSEMKEATWTEVPRQTTSSKALVGNP